MKQHVYSLSYCLKWLSHPAGISFFTSNVQCVRLAAGRRTRAPTFQSMQIQIHTAIVRS